MKVTCANCGKEFKLTRLEHDEINNEGFHTVCPDCGSSFDLDTEKISELIFVNDVAKMADFKALTKEEFLASYSYLTEEEYDATKLYMKWLQRSDDDFIPIPDIEYTPKIFKVRMTEATEFYIKANSEEDCHEFLSTHTIDEVMNMSQSIGYDFYEQKILEECDAYEDIDISDLKETYE